MLWAVQGALAECECFVMTAAPGRGNAATCRCSRLPLFDVRKRLISRWDAETVPRRLPQEEFLSLMLPNHGKQLARPARAKDLLHRRVMPKGAPTAACL